MVVITDPHIKVEPGNYFVYDNGVALEKANPNTTQIFVHDC